MGRAACSGSSEGRWAQRRESRSVSCSTSTACSTWAMSRSRDGAELVALQHNRYWRRADGLALDVGAYAAALEYATGREAVVVGKPAQAFFHAAMADMGVDCALMVGDDVEADVGGALAAGV